MAFPLKWRTIGSNFGIDSVDLFAPGYRILSTFPDRICSNSGLHINEIAASCVASGYHWDSGTSYAAPFVTGVAALMLSVNPNLTAVQLKDIITRTVDVVPALENYCVSGGRLNAYKAVRTAQMYYWANDITYEQLSPSDTLYTKAHGVWYDNCECSCRNDDLSCGSYYCDFGCDPCENCHYYFTELHNWRYSPYLPSNINTHRQYCIDCGYQTYSYHNWETVIGGYVCTDCGQEELIIPGEMMSLPDDELALYLASLSDEELEAFLAALPEDQLARVTAILPPENDDELLTE